MKIVALLAGLALLAACAQAPQSARDRGEETRARVHTELAALYYARGQYAVALQELEQALAAENAYAPAHNVLGLVWAALGEDAKADAGFQRALALQRNYSEAHNNYGWFLCQRGRHAEAIAQFEAALANPLYATPERALTNAGLCSLDQGNLAAAQDYLERALRRAPRLQPALTAMAELRVRQGRMQAARELLRQAAAVAELDARALWLGVRVERQLGDTLAEGAYATQLERRFPDSEEARWLRQGRYDRVGRPL
ncbi:MAG: type IV pilus biogenesis/stability protein PilW [Thiobacillaceae bacterium]|nr:type IV pilus biogenesis/stability protein PilW [Thiobacillaceae bacterium]